VGAYSVPLNLRWNLGREGEGKGRDKNGKEKDGGKRRREMEERKGRGGRAPHVIILH